MLVAGTVDPDRSVTLDQQSSSIVYIDLIVVFEVQLVITHPAPAVAHDKLCGAGDMGEQKSADAIRLDKSGHVWRLATV